MSVCLCRNILKSLTKEIILNKVKHDGVGGQYQMFTRFKVSKMKDPETVAAELKKAKNTVQLTDEGVFKHRGQLLNYRTTIDGKPVFPGKWKWKRTDEGANVLAGEVVCFQKRLNYHPGLNVGIGRDLTLYSYENGVVYITWEKVSFNFDNKFVQAYYYDQKDMNVYKPYYNVICKEQPKYFRLVDRI